MRHSLPVPRRARKTRTSARLRCCPGRPLAERIERAHVLDPVVQGCPTPWCARCRRAPGPMRCTACRSASRPSRAGAAAARLLDFGGAARGVPRHRTRGRDCSSRPGSRAPRPPRPPGWPTGRRCTGDQQRVGLVHALCQTGAATLFLGSLAARASGRTGYGRVLSASGLAVASIGSYLGGHLALRLGAGTSHAEQVSHLAGLGWHDLCDLRRPAAAAPGPAPARLPVPAGVPGRARGERAVRPVLAPRRAPASGTDRRGAGRCLRYLPVARIHFRRGRRHRRARTRHRPSAILRDPRDRRRPGRTQTQALTWPGRIRTPPGPIRTRQVALAKRLSVLARSSETAGARFPAGRRSTGTGSSR